MPGVKGAKCVGFRNNQNIFERYIYIRIPKL